MRSAHPHIQSNQKKKCRRRRRRLNVIKICEKMFAAAKFLSVPRLALSLCAARMRPARCTSLRYIHKIIIIRNNCFHRRFLTRSPFAVCVSLFPFIIISRIAQQQKIWPAYFKCWAIIISNNTIQRSCRKESISNSVSVVRGGSSRRSSRSRKEFPFRYLKTKTNLQCRLSTEERTKRNER